jgi:hypothetical protein
MNAPMRSRRQIHLMLVPAPDKSRCTLFKLGEQLAEFP